jgi:hypothetical protein
MGPPPLATPAAAIEIDPMFEYQPSTVASHAPIFLLAMVCVQDAPDALALPDGSGGIKRRSHALSRGLKLKPDT